MTCCKQDFFKEKQRQSIMSLNQLNLRHCLRIESRTSPDGYILCSWRWRSSILSAKTRLGVDCGSDHELLIAKFIHKFKKEGKANRLFRYDLNQIPYTVEVTNRFKGLDLIECPKNYGWRFKTLYRRQWPKPSPRGKKMQVGKMVVWEGFINSWKRKGSERQRRKGKHEKCFIRVAFSLCWYVNLY